MQLIAVQEDILVNPDKISVVERKVSKNNAVRLSVMVEGRTYEVTQPHQEFITSLNRAGVDLTKQFFAV
jgi:hypothetical protein